MSKKKGGKGPTEETDEGTPSPKEEKRTHPSLPNDRSVLRTKEEERLSNHMGDRTPANSNEHEERQYTVGFQKSTGTTCGGSHKGGWEPLASSKEEEGMSDHLKKVPFSVGPGKALLLFGKKRLTI